MFNMTITMTDFCQQGRLSLIVLATLVFFVQCTAIQKPMAEKNSKSSIPIVVEDCNAVAIIQNFTGEAGCHYYFRLQNIILVLPGELPETDVPFVRNAGVKIGHEVLDKDESIVLKAICTSEDHIVPNGLKRKSHLRLF
jgi:hypothetical protein